MRVSDAILVYQNIDHKGLAACTLLYNQSNAFPYWYSKTALLRCAMKEEYITGGSGTSYMIFTNEVGEESLAANEVYRLEIKVAKEPNDPYIFSCQASFDTEALYYARRIHSEKTELDLKEQWRREVSDLARHLTTHYF